MVGPVQLDRRRIGSGGASRVRNRRPARVRAQDPREVGNELFDGAPTLAAGPFCFDNFDPSLCQATVVRQRELGLRARGMHRAQLVEGARVESFEVSGCEQALYAFRDDSPVGRRQRISSVSRR